MTPPYFSIVIPVYNREREIQSAISSCLRQDFADFEVLVVDDASTDSTAEVVSRNDDDRVRLIRRTTNGGECPARNTGIDAARADWIILLDSDHELLDGALSRFHSWTASVPADVGRVGFMCRFDDGNISPFPPPTDEVHGYLDHVRWRERCKTSDLLMATRRSTFTVCRMPETRVDPLLYHLDFAFRFKEQWRPEFYVLQHTDSPNRLSVGYQGVDQAKLRQRAEDDLRNIEEIVSKHGPALRELAPHTMGVLRRERIRAFVLAGRQSAGIRASIRDVVANPLSPWDWMMLMLALCGPRVLLWATSWRRGQVAEATRQECMRASTRQPLAQ